MKIKKMLALALAALMLSALVPASAFAGGRSADKSVSADSVNSAYLNTHGCLLTYTELNGTYPCTTGTQGSHKYVQINNGGHANTTAGFVSRSIMMREGDKMKFDYWYYTELNYDFFRFSYVLDEEIHVEENISGNTGGDDAWFRRTFTAPSDGWYSFMFEYVKDGSGDVGADCVRISNLYVEYQWDQQRARAVTCAGTGVFDYDFRAGSTIYQFDTVTSTQTGHEEFIKSGNWGQANVTSAFVVSGRVPACTFSFDYCVSCEANSGNSYYDYFLVTIDGAEVLKVAGDHWSWNHAYYALDEGYHEIGFEYFKDSSTNSGEDAVLVDNIAINYPTDGVTRWNEINKLSNDEGVYFNTGLGYEYFGVTSYDVAYSANRNMHSSDSRFSTVINMAAGETLTFDYLVSSEPDYDKFLFSVNEQVLIEASGWADRDWSSFTFTAPAVGTYYFEWDYIKDSSVSQGWDCVYVCDIQYGGIQNEMMPLNTIVRFGSDPIGISSSFSNGPGFTPVIDDDGFYLAMSRSQFCNGSSAVMMGTPSGTVPAGSTISFDYKVSTEDNYDELWFVVKKNGTTVASEYLGSGDSDWEIYQYTCPSAGEYRFEWVYQKDGSGSEYDDTVWIADVYFERAGSGGVLMGDVNDDGAVNVTDALLVLRYSMGLISSLPVLAAADVNNSGSVDMTDALLVLRASMGIITL